MERNDSLLSLRTIFFLLLFFAIAGLLIINNQSFWMDEANTIDKASLPDLASWFRWILVDRNSDCQMPFYMFYMFCWQKIVPVHPEWLVRISNLPWFLLAEAAVLFGLRRLPRFAVALALLTALHPFLWYYMNEARPYIMQFTGAMLLAVVACRVATGLQKAKLDADICLAWAVGTLILCGSSMLGVAWAGTFSGVLLWFSRKNRPTITRSGGIISGTAVVALILLGGFYLHTLLVQHAKPYPGTTGVANIIFAIYELLGFAGLGPGRSEFRTGNIGLCIPWLPYLALYGLVAGVILTAGFRAVCRKFGLQTILVFGLAAIGPVVLTFACGKAGHARVLGRHLMPACVPLLFVLAAGMRSLKGNKRLMNIALIALMAVSALSIRFAQRHARDDFRYAAAVANEALAKSLVVWWVSDQFVAGYYSVPLDAVPGRNAAAVWLPHPLAEDLSGRAKPDWVVLARPDVYDLYGTVAHFLDSNHYQKQYQSHDITIWRKAD